MKNNQLFLQNYYQTPFYSPQKDYLPNPLNKAMNTNSISNKNININQYPSFPLMFEIPKQKSNINYIPRTPSPNYKRRNFINLSDNTKFKESSNSPIIYHQLKGMDSIKKYQQVNYHPIRYLSPQPLNLSKNNNSRFISLYQNSPILINIEQKQAKIVRTPEPKNNLSYNQYKSRNYNNINIVNNNSSYIYTAYNPLNSIKNITTIKPSNKNLIKQIPKGNNNNYLKIDYKANFINFNDSSRNKNYQLIHNMNKNNNSIDNNRNINITQNNNYNYLNNMNKSNNSINNNNNNNKNNNIIIKRLNNFDQNNNYLNNINIKKNYYLNLNNKFQSNFNIIKKNHKLEITDNYKNFIRNKNNTDIFHN